MSASAAAGRCLECGAASDQPAEEFAGLKGDPRTVRAVACSPACRDQIRRYVPRRSAQWQPAIAGYLVSALALATCPLFWLSGRDLGRVLLVLGVFGTATTRLAYPDVVPLGLGRRLGLRRATTALQWVGVGLGLCAVGLGVTFLLAN